MDSTGPDQSEAWGAHTLAILPFEDATERVTSPYFARGFVDDLVHELGRFPSLLVYHPMSAEAWGASHRSASEAPWADHLLRGSVRHSPDALLVTVQLMEARSGRQIWSQRLQAQAGESIQVQHELAGQLASTLALRLDETRLRQVRRQPASSLAVYDLWLRGHDCLRQGTLESDGEARTYFQRALELDPRSARAMAGLSLSHFNEWSCLAWEKWDEKERWAHHYAQRALALDDADPIVHLVLSRILLFRREFAPAEHHIRRAVELNDCDADMLAQAAMLHSYLGAHEAALQLGDRARRLNPFFAQWYYAPSAMALLFLGRYRESADLGERAPEATVDFHAYLAVARALDGQVAAARESLERFLGVFQERVLFGRAPEPGETLRWLLHVNPFREAHDRDRFVEGLLRAGLHADPDQGRTASTGAVPSEVARFQCSGDVWNMDFAGETVQLRDVKGFHDLAYLLARPDEDIHCLELAGRDVEGGGQPVFDEAARHQLRARMRDLEAALDEAELDADLGRAEALQRERDALVESVAQGLALGGRVRQLGNSAEKARSAVTWRLRSALQKIVSAHPALGRHLSNSVRTGTFCRYSPERPQAWQL